MNNFTLENTKDATHAKMVNGEITLYKKTSNDNKVMDSMFFDVYQSKWVVSGVYRDYSELIQLSRPYSETREYWTIDSATKYAQPQGNEMDVKNLIPISYVKKITPLVVGDVLYNSSGEMTLYAVKATIISISESESIDHLFVVSFADRPNTGKQPVGNGVIVDCKWNVEPFTESGEADQFFWEDRVDEESVVKWKPNHAAMLKQWQAKQVTQEAKRMDNIAMNGNDGDHYEQSHHIALQIEALGPVDSTVELGGLDDEVKEYKYSDVGDSVESKPVFTQAMADAGESVAVGMVFTTEVTGGRYVARLINDKSVCFTDENGFLVAIPIAYAKPIQTGEQKLRELLVNTIWKGSLESKEFVEEDVDDLLASDKFTITLKD